jgi:hypothetical protein
MQQAVRLLAQRMPQVICVESDDGRVLMRCSERGRAVGPMKGGSATGFLCIEISIKKRRV